MCVPDSAALLVLHATLHLVCVCVCVRAVSEEAKMRNEGGPESLLNGVTKEQEVTSTYCMLYCTLYLGQCEGKKCC